MFDDIQQSLRAMLEGLALLGAFDRPIFGRGFPQTPNSHRWLRLHAVAAGIQKSAKKPLRFVLPELDQPVFFHQSMLL